MDKLELPVRSMLYRFPYGNHLGVVSFIWKIPAVGSVNESKVSQLIAKLNDQHKMYASREMRKEFLQQYYTLTKTSKSVLRNIYKTLLGDSSAAPSEVERAVDERMVEALLQVDDPEILYDLRKLNGRPKSNRFDAFWEELGVYIEELTQAVDDRWHSETPHMPVAISLCHLRQLIKERLELKNPGEDIEVPSLEWLRLQFWPPNPYSSSTLRYTGKLKLKFGVQVRQLRHTHVDSRYVSIILR